MFAQQSTDLMLRGGNVVDVIGATVIREANVWISDGLVVAVSTDEVSNLSVPETLDIRGSYVMPGLIDSHVHLASAADQQSLDDVERRLGVAFRSGVTAVRDMGGNANLLRLISEWSFSPAVDAPRVYYSALFGGPRLFRDIRWVPAAGGELPGEQPWLREIVRRADAHVAVADAVDIGAVGIKLYSDIPSDVIKELSSEAHSQGLRVWSHAMVYPSRPLQVVEGGVDVVSHAALLAWEAVADSAFENGAAALGLPVRFQLGVGAPDFTRLLLQMKELGVALEPTLFRSTVIARSPPGTLGIENPREAAEWAYAITGRAFRLGVSIIAGTDELLSPLWEAYLPVELELLVDSAGLKPMDAIRAATINPARALGLHQHYGAVAVGRVADLVVLGSDPTTNISNVRDVLYVIKGGNVHRIAAFDRDR